MKKLVIWLVVIALAATMAFIGISCQAAAATTTTAAAAETTVAATTSSAAEETAEGAGEQGVEGAEEKNPADFEIVFIVKADGIPWFDVERLGLTACAKDYGFKASVVGPPKADAALQAQMVEDYISKGVQAIAVCPNDPASIEPVFQKANAAGILTFGHEGSSFKNVSFDIEAMSNEVFGQSIMKDAITFSGSKGGYVASVGFLTSVSHNLWVDAEIAYQQANAPDFKDLLGYNKGSDRFEEKEDQSIAHDKILEYLKTYPELNVVIGSPMTTGAAAGVVIEEKSLQGKLFFVGTGLPITIGKFLKADYTFGAGYFWDPYQVGYALGYVALNTWMGKPPVKGDSVVKPDGTKNPGYETLDIITNENGGNVIFGTGQVRIDKANVDEWYQKFADYGWVQQ